VKERQVNQITAPVEVAKKMYEMQQERLRDILVGPQTQTQKPESINGVEVKELIRHTLSQLEIE
tara:strand:- start:268 stop:459 length:192 start_codon:yes stop_codon:yes gene_type:complete